MISFVGNLFAVYGAADRPSEKAANEAASPALANAERLIRDASLLREHGRVRSAVALTVLAQEEFGKAALLKWKSLLLIERGIDADLASHERKQSVTAAYDFGKALQQAARRGESLSGSENHAAPIADLGANPTASEVGENLRSLFSSRPESTPIENAGALVSVMSADNFGEALTSSLLARFRLLDSAKFSGFYFDNDALFAGGENDENSIRALDDLISRFCERTRVAVGLPFWDQVVAALCYESSAALRAPRPKASDLPEAIKRLTDGLEKLSGRPSAK